MRRAPRRGQTPDVAEDDTSRRPVKSPDPTRQGEVLRLQARAGNRVVARMLLRGAQIPAEPVLQRIGAGIEAYVRDGQQVTHRAHEEWGAGTIVAIDGERYVVEFPADVGRQTVEAPDLEPAGSNAEIQGDEGKVQEAAALPGDERSEGPVATYLSIEKSKPKKWHLILLDESRREIVKVPDVGESVVKGYVVTPKSLIVQEKMSMVQGRTALVLKPGVQLPGPLANAYAKTLKDLAAKKDLEAYLARYAETSRVSNTATSSAGPSTFPTQAEVMERLRRLQTARKMTGLGHGAVTMTSILLRSPVELIVENDKKPITHLYTQVGRTDKDGRALEIRCYLGNAQGAYQRVHTSLTEDDPMRAHTMVQTGAQVAIPQWKGRAVGERVGFDSVENGKGLGGRTLDARTDAKASTVKDANRHVWIRGLDFMTLTETQRAHCRQLAGTFNLALDSAIADVMDETFDLYRTVTGTTQDFQILDDVWQGGEKATPDKGKARAVREPLASGSRRPVKSKQTESTSEASGSGMVRARDARDEASFRDHRFAPSVTGIRDLGECFWDTLRKRGVDDVALSKAAGGCDIAVDAAVDVDRIGTFLEALASKADRKVSVVLVRFDIFTLDYVGHETIGPPGGGAQEIFVGFFYDLDKGLGHYVPELD